MYTHFSFYKTKTEMLYFSAQHVPLSVLLVEQAAKLKKVAYGKWWG